MSNQGAEVYSCDGELFHNQSAEEALEDLLDNSELREEIITESREGTPVIFTVHKGTLSDVPFDEEENRFEVHGITQEKWSLVGLDEYGSPVWKEVTYDQG